MVDDKLVIKSKRSKGDDEYKTFSLRVREDVVEKIDDISSKSGRSRNELIGLFLEYATERCIVENKL